MPRDFDNGKARMKGLIAAIDRQHRKFVKQRGIATGVSWNLRFQVAA
jgi:hypothetical protein